MATARNGKTTTTLFQRPPALGVVVRNPGGRLGWLARRVCPAMATGAYLAYIRLTRAPAVRRRIDDFFAVDPPPCFTHVEIETLNRCNGECAFCPVNRHIDPRPPLRMTEDLFTHLLEELSILDYDGYLGLFSNNEPLLDTRLPSFAAAARAALPRAFMNLSTNGSLLDREMLRSLLPHFDRIVINNYRESPVLYEAVRRVLEFLESAEGRMLLTGKTVEISLRNPGDILTSRAGNAPNRAAPGKPLAMPCSLPFSQLIIRPDGKLSLCCNDALGQMTMGDAARQGLIEAWHGDGYRRVRQVMVREGRRGLPLCRACDFVKHDVN